MTGFSGSNYEAKFDEARLTGQIERVYNAMKDGEWRTLSEIQTRIMEMTRKNDGEASISAQLRNLKKKDFGKHTLEKRSRGERVSGLYEYKLTVNVPIQEGLLF